MHLISFHITSNQHKQYVSISIKYQYNTTYIKIIESNNVEHVFYDTHQNTIEFLSNIFQTIDKIQYNNIQVVIPFSITRNINILDPEYMKNINSILYIYSNMISSNGEVILGSRQCRD